MRWMRWRRRRKEVARQSGRWNWHFNRHHGNRGNVEATMDSWCGCRTNLFRCGAGKCIPKRWVPLETEMLQFSVHGGPFPMCQPLPQRWFSWDNLWQLPTTQTFQQHRHSGYRIWTHRNTKTYTDWTYVQQCSDFSTVSVANDWRTWPRVTSRTDWPHASTGALQSGHSLLYQLSLLFAFWYTTRNCMDFSYLVVCQVIVDPTWSCCPQVRQNVWFGRSITNRPTTTMTFTQLSTLSALAYTSTTSPHYETDVGFVLAMSAEQ